MTKNEAPGARRRPKVTKPATPTSAKVQPAPQRPATVSPSRAAAVMRPRPCKISAGFRLSASDMPVTINLCKDTQGTPATEVQLVSVDVYDAASGAAVANQPTDLKSNSFTLNLKAGTYDINSTVGPGSGASLATKPTVYLYEACANPTTQLCAFITAAGPGCGFTLTVI
jgi:hypothetical protein